MLVKTTWHNKTVNGFTLFAVLVVLILTSITIIASMKSYAHYKRGERYKAVGEFATNIMPTLKSYYETECYFNGGTISPTITLEQLKSDGYLIDSYSDTPMGASLLRIDQSANTVLGVQITFSSIEEANFASSYKTQYKSSKIGNVVLWQTSISSFKHNMIDKNSDAQLLVTQSCS
jgi:Tfp pilus assembly protein PilE